VTRAYVGLGSNLGDRRDAIEEALRRLDAVPGVHVAAVSRIYESEPWGAVDQPAFANAVAALEVDAGAAELLAAAKRIEREMGRGEGPRNGPRPIDIDVLLFGLDAVETPELTVPHPRLLERDFVVTPLLEIAPDVTLPDGTRPDPARATEGRVTGVIA
jgi:2-amino-4-hydroxy-6-hydroxymethyldihydropteridine diphosphokinase